jgi:hypothetical protein
LSTGSWLDIIWHALQLVWRRWSNWRWLRGTLGSVESSNSPQGRPGCWSLGWGRLWKQSTWLCPLSNDTHKSR